MVALQAQDHQSSEVTGPVNFEEPVSGAKETIPHGAQLSSAARHGLKAFTGKEAYNPART